jgi:hypothetical protein
VKYRNALALMGSLILALAAFAGFAAFAIDGTAPTAPAIAVEAPGADPAVSGGVAGAVFGSAFATAPDVPAPSTETWSTTGTAATSAALLGPTEAYLIDPPAPTTTTTTTTTTTPPTTTTTVPRTTTTTAPPTTTTTTTTTPPATTTTTTAPAWSGGGAEAWRPLVTAYFPAARVDEALSVIHCESQGDPDAVNRWSGAAGLFQFVPSTWAWASAGAGFDGVSPLSPEANIAAAAWLVRRSLAEGDGAWSHWVCKP